MSDHTLTITIVGNEELGYYRGSLKCKKKDGASPTDHTRTCYNPDGGGCVFEDQDIATWPENASLLEDVTVKLDVDASWEYDGEFIGLSVVKGEVMDNG